MPRIAKLIEVEQSRTTPSGCIVIDGEPFPFMLSEDGVDTQVRHGEMPSVTVTILAEEVRVLNSVASLAATDPNKVAEFFEVTGG